MSRSFTRMHCTTLVDLAGSQSSGSIHQHASIGAMIGEFRFAADAPLEGGVDCELVSECRGRIRAWGSPGFVAILGVKRAFPGLKLRKLGLLSLIARSERSGP